MSLAKENPNLEDAISKVWEQLDKRSKECAEQDKHLKYNGNFQQFKNEFITVYKNICKNYMRNSVQELDRHKIVAVMIVAFINCNFFVNSRKNVLCLAPHMISLEIGLNWMMIGLNRALKDKGIEKELDEYVMPEAFACPTPYFDIFARNLYYGEHDGNKLNALDIAEKLFLLEYITLLCNDISPKCLSYKN